MINKRNMGLHYMKDFAIQILTASAGRTHLFSTGQAGYIIKSKSGQLLAIDLYLSECVERLEENKGFKRLLPRILEPYELQFDVVICTHPHLDHFDIDSIPEIMSNEKTKLFCSVNCKKIIENLQLKYYNSRIKYVKPLESYNVGDFRINFVNCDHGRGAPDAVGVVITVDGKRIYEAGDTCLRLDRIDEILKPLDVLIAPINGAFGNMNEDECSQLAEVLNPSITIPCHYGMFASHHGDIGKFYNIMMKKNLPILLMKQGEAFIL